MNHNLGLFSINSLSVNSVNYTLREWDFDACPIQGFLALFIDIKIYFPIVFRLRIRTYGEIHRRIAIKEVISIPSIPNTLIARSTFSTMENRLCEKVFRETSSLQRLKIRSSPLPAILITHKPIIHTIMTPIILGP